MRWYKNVGERSSCISNIRSALKCFKNLSNQSIYCCRIIIIKKITLLIITIVCINGGLVCFIINYERRIFSCYNFFAVNYFGTLVFSEKAQDTTQNRCIFLCNNNKRRNHGDAFCSFIYIAFFITGCNGLHYRFHAVVRTYPNTNNIRFPNHIGQVFQACLIAQNFFINT